FLPMAVLRRAGYEEVREGASIVCEISAGAKGPLVTTVLNVDNSTAVAPQSGGSRYRPPPSHTLGGRGKWFEPGKGYGLDSPGGRRVTALFRRTAGVRTCLSTSPRCAAAE